MVYINKEKKKCQLIYSDCNICVIVWEDSEEGIIFNGNKDKFKKLFKKTKDKDFIEEDLKEHIIDTVQNDYVGITEYPQDYSDWSARMWQSEDEFKKILEEYKDK